MNPKDMPEKKFDITHALRAIVMERDTRLLSEMLEQGLCPNTRIQPKDLRKSLGGSLVHAASRKQRGKALSLLFEAGACSIAYPTENGEGFESPELSWLYYRKVNNLEGNAKRADEFWEVWQAFVRGNADFSASHPQESCNGEVWTPLALVLSPVLPLRNGLFFNGFEEHQQNNALHVFSGQLLSEMEKRPGVWSPEAAQMVFEGAAQSCDASVLPWLRQHGLKLETIPNPRRVLEGALSRALVDVEFGRTTEENALLAGGWLDVLAGLNVPCENKTCPSLRAAYENKRLLANLSPSSLSSTSRLRL